MRATVSLINSARARRRMLSFSRLVRVVGFGTLLVLATASAVLAQAQIEPPKPYELTDQNYVSLVGLSLSVPTTTIGIGQSGQGGLTYSATFDASANAWRHSTFGGIDRKITAPSIQRYQWYNVTILGRTVVFQDDGAGALVLVEGSGTGTLTFDSLAGKYTYTANDGTIATIDRSLRTVTPFRANEGLITRIVKPDGETIDFIYASVGSSLTDAKRIQSITNNLGYQLHFDYASQVAGTDAWSRFTKVTALNMGVEYCAPSAVSCTLSQPWPSLTFGDNGLAYLVTDTLGRTQRLIRDVAGQVTGIARPSTTTGQNLTVVWSGPSPAGVRVVSVSDGVGTWTYDKTVPLNPGDAYYYTTTTVTDPLTHSSEYDFEWFDPNADGPDQTARENRLLKITNALGQEIDVMQDGVGLHHVVNPEGDRVDYPRNARGDLIGIIRTPKSGTGPTSVTAVYGDCSTPVSCGRPTSITNQRGAVTNISYFAHGGVNTVTRPAAAPGATRSETHNTFAQLTAWYHNSPTTFTQGAPVWRQTETSACAIAATCPGTANEVVVYTSYEAGSTSQRSNLLPLSVTNGSGDGVLAATKATSWDVNGDPTYVDGPLPGTSDITRTFHDAMRQTIGVIGSDPDGVGTRLYPATRTTYNADGQVTTIERGTTTAQTDLAWSAFSTLQTATTLYNAQGHKQRDVGMAGSVMPSVTDYAYDAAGNRVCTTVRMNPATFGTVTPACTMTTAGSYGPDRKRTLSYDELNRVITTRDAVDTSDVRTTSIQAYTPNGKVDWIEDAAGNRSNYTYDDFDRLARLEFPSATVGTHTPNSNDFEEYGYDQADNPISKQTRAGLMFTTTFDGLNRPTVITAPTGSDSVEYLYDLLDRRTSASHAVGVRPIDCTAVATLCMAWDALGRQTAETGPLGAMSYQYDLAGRRTRMTWPDAVYVTYAWDLDGSMTAIRLNGSSLITGYAYDDLARRTGITRGNGVPTNYVWDTASYLTTLTQDPAGSGSDLIYGFTHNPAGQILNRTMSNSAYDYAPVNASTPYINNGLNQNTTVGGVTLTWSTQGNLTNNGAKTFTYDAANRLTGTAGSTLTYDPLDRLYLMTGTGVGRFQYDGDQVAAVYPAASTTIAERYVRGPSPDEWAVIYTGSGTGSPSYPLQNHQQSVIALTDGSGVATSTLAYDAYGQPRSGNLGRFQYTGQMMLPDYGLQHYKGRAYDAALGRLVQTDPAGYQEGLNLYAYAGSDPINGTDPKGRETYNCSGGVGTGNCQAGTQVQAGDVIQTSSGTYTVAQGGGFSIGQPVSAGTNATLTDSQVAAVVFNETRSLTGDEAQRARQMVAHAVINGDESKGSRRPMTGPTSASVPEAERPTYASAEAAVSTARAQREVGRDPTGGAVHFNLRNNPGREPFQGHQLTTQSGPLNNSYPTAILPSSGIYVNTYQ